MGFKKRRKQTVNTNYSKITNGGIDPVYFKTNQMHNLTELDEYFKNLKRMRETKNSLEKQRLTKWLNDYLDKSTITKYR